MRDTSEELNQTRISCVKIVVEKRSPQRHSMVRIPAPLIVPALRA